MRLATVYTARPSASRLVLLLLWSSAVGIVLWGDAAVSRAGDGALVESRLRETVSYLASDELEGRGVDTAGIQKAADYLAVQFQDAGLSTSVFAGDAFQPFVVAVGAELGPPDENRLVLTGPAPGNGAASTFDLKLGEDFSPLAIGGSGQLQAPLVFVGYGISAPQHQYDEFAGLDVKGKVVLLLRKEPQQENPQSVFEGRKSSRHAHFATKVSAAYQHGAAAVILVNDEVTVKQAAGTAQRQWKDALARLNSLREKFQSLAEPSDSQFAEHRAEVLKVTKELESLEQRFRGNFDEILPLDGAGTETSHPKLPVFYAKRALIDGVLKQAVGAGLSELESKIDENLVPQSRVLEGWTATCHSQVVHRQAEVRNVAGVLEGVGPLAQETILIGAHYDHLGFGGPGSLAPWTREVHNGADDNASGTALLLELARSARGLDETRSRRKLVFVAFAAEERGLLGSQQYVRQPPYALEQTVAMINLDMVGRLTDNRLIVYGTGTAQEFDPLVNRLNEQYRFDLKKEPGGYGPSDHATFYAKQIPVLHFFTGTHNDYHRPSDDVDKLNLEGMRRIHDMAWDIVREVATAEARPQYLATKGGPLARSGDRPYFGSIPQFGQEGKGYALMEVAKDSPAEKAGIRAGDVIVQLGAAEIGSLDDFDGALRKYSAGDKVTVRVRRGDEVLELIVTLEPPR